MTYSIPARIFNKCTKEKKENKEKNKERNIYYVYIKKEQKEKEKKEKKYTRQQKNSVFLLYYVTLYTTGIADTTPTTTLSISNTGYTANINTNSTPILTITTITANGLNPGLSGYTSLRARYKSASTFNDATDVNGLSIICYNTIEDDVIETVEIVIIDVYFIIIVKVGIKGNKSKS